MKDGIRNSKQIVFKWFRHKCVVELMANPFNVYFELVDLFEDVSDFLQLQLPRVRVDIVMIV